MGLSTAVLLAGQVLFNAQWSFFRLFIRWDAGWYGSVAEFGYRPGGIYEQTNVAFFPLYPLLVRAVFRLTHMSLVAAGLTVSLVCFTVALVVFYDLVARRYGEAVARMSTLLLAFNPFGLFFGLMYTESLFLLLSVLTFWLIDRRWWWWAAVAAAAGSATRSVGVALAAIVVASWMVEHRDLVLAKAKRRWLGYGLTVLGLGAISVSGLLLFSLYLWQHNHDFLGYVHAVRYWGRTGVSNLWPQLHGAVHELLHHPPYAVVFEYLVWYGSLGAGLVGLGLLLWQRDWWLAIFVAMGLAAPLLSGTVGSINRYTMVLFPLYIGFTRALKERERILAVVASGLLFVGFWLIYVSPRQLFFG